MNEWLLSSLIITLASVPKKPHILGSARARIDLWVGPYHFSNLFVSFPRGRPCAARKIPRLHPCNYRTSPVRFQREPLLPLATTFSLSLSLSLFFCLSLAFSRCPNQFQVETSVPLNRAGVVFAFTRRALVNHRRS